MRARNYPENLIKSTITWAKSLDRSETLEKVVRERGEEGVVNCLMRFDTRSPDHASIMKRHCKLMIERGLKRCSLNLQDYPTQGLRTCRSYSAEPNSARPGREWVQGGYSLGLGGVVTGHALSVPLQAELLMGGG